MSGDVFQTGPRSYIKPDVLLRTRRSVMEAANLIHEKRLRQRRHAGIALLTVAALMVLVSPALWSAASDLTTGEHFFDMPVMVLTLSLILLAAMVAILLMTWQGGRHGEAGRRQ
jgi:cytochrome bd-type quinol oxidase subunit 2